MKNKLVFLFLVFAATFIVYPQKQKISFRDTLDNAIDVSEFLKKKYGFLPLLVPITEPAVGYGAVIGGLYFLPKKDASQKSDIIVAAGGLTSNGTWLAGAGYLGFWKNDKIRYRGVAGYGDVKLAFYGLGGDKPLDFDLSAFLFLQQANFRIGESNFFIGGKYQFSQITIPVFKGNDLIDPIDFDMINSGLALIAEYDNLNNFFSPTKGLRVHLSYDQNLEFLGSDKNWGIVNFFSHFYFPVSEKWVPALRIESSLATGKTPFYAKPFVSLRGVPALRYQGDLTLVAETEQLFNITPRWAALGFTGIGTAFRSVDNLKFDELVWNAGGGLRYLIARSLGLKIGADLARGPEDWAFYVAIGTSWLK